MDGEGAGVLLADGEDDVRAWLAQTPRAPFIAVDTETTGFDPWVDKLRTIQLAADPGEPVLVIDTARLPPAVLVDVLADPGVLKVFHNAAFDLRMLWRAGLEVVRV
ncbi:MAG TPA: hypothetical protein VMM13_04285, partial [Euzebya sp.]|nr:hypothetical protein [Euzebya sp.]